MDHVSLPALIRCPGDEARRAWRLADVRLRQARKSLAGLGDRYQAELEDLIRSIAADSKEVTGQIAARVPLPATG